MANEPLLNLTWKRPESATYPSIWRRFERRDSKNPSLVRRFRVQDVTEDVLPALMHLMETDFILDEPLSKSVKLAEDTVSLQEFRQLYVDIAKQKVALVCLEEDSNGEILKKDGVPVVAGYNMIYIISKTDSKERLKGKVIVPFIDVMFYYSTKEIDLFEKYGVDAVITALGLSVGAPYRGMGLGAEILKAREDVGRAVGVSVISTVFSSVAAKRSAAKIGYETLVERSVADAYLERPDLVFPGIFPETTNYMIKIIDP